MTNDITCIDAARELWKELKMQRPDIDQQIYTQRLAEACIEEAREAKGEDPSGFEILLRAKDQDEKEHFALLASHGLTTTRQRDAWTVFHFAGLYLKKQSYGLPDFSRPIKAEDYRTLYLPDAIEDGLRCLQDKYWGLRSMDDDITIAMEFKTKAANYISREIQTRIEKNVEFLLLEKVRIKPVGAQEVLVSAHYETMQ